MAAVAIAVVYRFKGNKPTSFRASILQPECLLLARSHNTSAIQFNTNTRPFSDAPSHVYRHIAIGRLPSECQSSVLRVCTLEVQIGRLSLRSGSTVHECTNGRC
eukprot:TRINITY_DN10285_c0_g1_i1.p6 TRINITY_DN10285_c0_g1~~TRINITY_DN10285_c0_g1_i1.p6  ORF type:complete len:104 (+),score=3.30 TRINITY_DN10285_c0_g1_i1:514-825(+)